MFKRSDARTALSKSLLDALTVFGADATAQQPHLDRQLDAATADFNRVAPRLVSTTLTLVADTANYAAPADALRWHSTELIDDQAEKVPWDEFRLQTVPTPFLTVVEGTRCWQFRPTPTTFMLDRIGSVYPYTYVAGHKLSETEAETTLQTEQLPLLILRAQVEALRELAIRNAHKPIAVRDGMHSQTKNGTPAAIAEQFMRLWEQLVRPAADLYGTLRTGGGGLR
jgi:hypothetical protein